jgi:hypothetical protein
MSQIQRVLWIAPFEFPVIALGLTIVTQSLFAFLVGRQPAVGVEQVLSLLDLDLLIDGDLLQAILTLADHDSLKASISCSFDFTFDVADRMDC